MTLRTTIDLSVALSSTQGFTILGGAEWDNSGWSVASAGDVNNDGYSDIIISAYRANPNSRWEAGQSYVIYGRATNLGTIDLSVALSSTQGFTILGGAADDRSGCSVASAGDVNNDGYNDIIIGAYGADPNSRTNAGQSYVIYGSATNPGTIDLSVALSSTQGFTILGGAASDWSGYSVASAGDVNNDGFDDIIIGAYGADPSSRSYAGKSYVIYGSATNPGTMDLSVALSSTQGFTILGGAPGDWSSFSVASAGDVNNDGYDDIIIGAPYASPSSRVNAGQSYVIYGSATNPGTIDLSVALSSTQGFTILGCVSGDYSGVSANAAGDVNNDGYSDIIIGAYRASPSSRSYAGQSYVIYGSATNPGTIDLSIALSSTQGFAVLGGAAYDRSGSSVASAGDVNNDGFDDIIIGAYYASPSSRDEAGQSYVIYGSATNPGTIDLSIALSSTQRFTILGGVSADYSGWSVASAGDINNDGYNDIIIGAYSSDPNSRTNAGQSYVIYGAGSDPSQPTVEPSGHPTLNPTIAPTSSPSLIPSAVSTTITPTLSSTTAFTSSMPTLSPSGHPTTIPSDNPINSSDEISMLSIIGIIIGSLSGTCIFGYATYKCYDFRSKSGVKIADDADNNHISLSNQERHTKNYNGDVLLSIDAVSDPIHYNFQNKEFTMFANHLTHFIKEDLVKNIESIGKSALSQLLIKPAEDETKIVSVDQEFVPNNIQSYDDSILQLLNAKQILHNLPLLHYITQNTIDSLGYNISLPNPSDNKGLLVSLDLVLGNAVAQYLPAESVMNAMFVSTASSISFAARLITADYLKNQEPSDEPIEFAQQCGLTIAAHSLPSIVNYAFTKAFLPNSAMSLDILSTASFGVVQCYNNYKVAYDVEGTSSTLNTVVPYIADAFTLLTLKDYMAFDTSSVGSLSVSIKNAISVAATTYAAHCVSDMMTDFIPQGIHEYIDTAFSYVTETANDLLDNLYDHLMDGSML